MHKEFKRLLEKATGVSEHVIVINLDIRGFSSFCQQSQDWDVANYIKFVYSKILDEYFDIASYYKPTGDGLVIIIPCKRSNVKERVNYVVDSCLKLVENFSAFCNGEPILNFPKPSKIGIGIARGSICCISNSEEGKILDYSGRILNLASRLMDMARPAGIVIDESLGQDLLKDEYQDLFIDSKVYVKGISENVPITIYHTKKETSIAKEYKSPQIEQKWNTIVKKEIYKNIKAMKRGDFIFYLKPKPLDDNEVYLAAKTIEPDSGKTIIKHHSSKDKEIEIIHRGNKHIAQIDRQEFLDALANYNVADNEEIIFEIYYPI